LSPCVLKIFKGHLWYRLGVMTSFLHGNPMDPGSSPDFSYTLRYAEQYSAWVAGFLNSPVLPTGVGKFLAR